LEFGRRLVAGEQLYAPFSEPDEPLHPVYPPSFGLLTAPFTLVPERAARFLWGALQVLSLGVVLRVLRHHALLRAPWLAHRVEWLLLGTFLLAGRYVLRDTHGGGGNSINLALALLAFVCSERGRPLLGGAFLGISLATKPTTVLLLPLFLVLDRVRIAAVATLVALAAFTLALVLHGSAEPGRQWIEGSLAYARIEDVGQQPEHGFPPFTWMNQSLRYAVQRWLGVTAPAHAAEVPGFFPGLGLAPAVTVWITRILRAGLLGATLLFAHRRRATAAGRFAALAATLAGGLLLSPISWKAHHVALLPVFLLLTIRAFDGNRAARVLWVAYFVLCSAGGGDLVGDAAKEWQQSLYLATFGTLGLWAWLLAAERSR